MSKNNSFSPFVIRFLSFSFLFLASAVLISHFMPSAPVLTAFVPASPTQDPLVVVLDPGHGGEDGGTSSASGLMEKDLNLAVSETSDFLCRLFGFSCVRTRTEDRQIYDLYGDLSDYTGSKKLYDLRNRVRLTREAAADLFVSLHMNQNPVASCRGLQVYYGNTEGSASAATLVQHYAKEFLEPDNKRAIKPADNHIFLLRQMEMPSILIECGFLSNPEEAKQLANPEFQLRLSATITAALAEFLCGTP